MSTLILGAGHNALVAAYYLAKAGRKPIVLERRAEVGGGAITGELAPGFRVPTLTHEVLLHHRIVSELALARHGLELLTSAVDTCALDPSGGPPVVLYEDPARSVESLARVNPRDAQAYADYRAVLERLVPVVASLLGHAAPGLSHLRTGDVWHLLLTARAFRGFGRVDARRLLRWLPMPVADLMDEWFEHDLLKATIAAPALSGTMRGPRSAGSTLVMFLREAHMHLARARGLRARGGPGAVTRALAAAAVGAGAEIRTSSGVDRILVNGARVIGVVAGGQEIPATTIVSGLDPRSTFLGLLDPGVLDAEFSTRMRNYRARGALAKLNLALSGLPAFRGVALDPGLLSGRIHLGPTLDYLERAFDRIKYGELPRDPWLQVSLPSILDPGLAPRGAHVASVYVHYAPYHLADNTWARAKVTLERSALDVLEGYAPGIRGQVVAAEFITPDELEHEYGFAGGHVFHGELAPDQLFSMRPQLGYERYATPIQGLFLCGAGTHPGGFMTGTSGRLAARAVLETTSR